MVRCEIDGNKRRDRWSKIVSGVDRSAKGGYTIEGQFCSVCSEMDLAPGTVVIRCDRDMDVYVFVVEEGANDCHCQNLRLVVEEEANDYLNLRNQLPSLLDRIERALGNQADPKQSAIDQIKRLMAEHSITITMLQ